MTLALRRSCGPRGRWACSCVLPCSGDQGPVCIDFGQSSRSSTRLDLMIHGAIVFNSGHQGLCQAMPGSMWRSHPLRGDLAGHWSTRVAGNAQPVAVRCRTYRAEAGRSTGAHGMEQCREVATAATSPRPCGSAARETGCMSVRSKLNARDGSFQRSRPCTNSAAAASKWRSWWPGNGRDCHGKPGADRSGAALVSCTFQTVQTWHLNLWRELDVSWL